MNPYPNAAIAAEKQIPISSVIDLFKSITCLGVIAVLTLTACSTSFAETKSRQPNIVFIHCDDLRPDMLSVSGHDRIRTPRIDRLAKEGIRFTHAFAAAGTCSPSRGAFWTGRYPHAASTSNITHQNNSFLETQTMFTDQLKQAGYQNVHIGKWHLGRDEGPHPAFTNWYGWKDSRATEDAVLILNGEKEIQTTGFIDDAMTDLAAEHIAKMAGGDQPFFISLGLKSPHRPFAYPDRLKDRFVDQEIPKPATFSEDYAESGRDPFIQRRGSIYIKNFGFERAKGFHTWDTFIKNYYRAAESIDRNVGVIMDALINASVDENTILFFLSDQGYNLGDHGLVEKHLAYEEVMRVPLIIRWPKGIQPAVSDALVSLVDLAPSILEWTGLPIPDTIQGRSLAPIVENAGATPEDWREAIFFAFQARTGNLPGQTAVRTRDYKYIHSSRGHHEFYDLKNDPHETHNVIDSPEYADIVNSVRNQYEAITEEIGFLPRPRRQALLKMHVIRNVSREDALALSERLHDQTFDPNTPIQINGNQHEWHLVQASGTKKLFKPGDIPGDESVDGLTLIALPVRRLTEYDPHLAIWISPWPETSLYWRGRELWTYEKKAGNLCNPPLASTENTVIITLDDIKAPFSVYWESMQESVEVAGKKP